MGIRSATLTYALVAWLLATGLLVVLLNYQRIALNNLDQVHHVGFHQLHFAMNSLVHFKKQIQEWKNILLRGQSRKDYEYYLSLFEQEESQTRENLEILINLLNDAPEMQLRARSFLETHIRLGEKYREALKHYNTKSVSSIFSVDKSIRGVDRNPTELLEKLTQDTIVNVNAAHEAVEEAENNRLERRRTWGAIAILAWLVSSSWILARWIIRPLTRATKIANKIGEGNYDTPIEPARHGEVGLLLTALESMQSRIRTDTTLLKHQRLEIEIALQEARAADIAKSRFLAIISHELRTPLNGISGAQQLLVLQSPSDEQRDLLNVIESSSNQLLRLVDRILFYVDLEEGAQNAERIVNNLHDLKLWLTGVMKKYEPNAVEKGLRLKLEDSEQSVPPIRLASRLVEIAVGELLDNAIKFSQKGTVTLAYALEQASDQHFLRITVQDQGSGIPQNVLPLEDYRLQQADDSFSRVHGGIGLGLSLCQRVANSLGGVLLFEAVPDIGTRVTLKVAVAIETGY